MAGVSSTLYRALRSTLLLLTLLIAAALYTLLATATGLRAAAALVQRYGGSTLQLGAVHGRLLGHFELDDLHYAGAGGLRLSLARLQVDWSPAALLQRRLRLRAVTVRQLALKLPAAPPSSAAPSLSLPARLPLNLQVDALHVDGFTLQRAGAARFTLASTQFAGSWIGDRLRVTRLHTMLPQTGPLTLTATAVSSATQLDLQKLTLTGPGTLSAHGTLGYGSSAWHLALSGHDLRWPLRAAASGQPPALDVSQAQLQLDGPLSAYRYTLAARGRSQGKPLQLDVQGRGDLQQTQIHSLTVDASAAGRVDVSGTARWAPQFSTDLDLKLHDVDPGLFVASATGRLNGRAQTRTRAAKHGAQMHFKLQLDHSQLRGYPLTLDAAGTATPRQLTLDRLTLNAAKGRLQAHGVVGWKPALRADLALQLQHLDPGVFLPAFPGDLNGSVQLHSSAAAVPLIRYSVDLDHSQLRGKPLRLQAHGSAQPQAARPVLAVDALQLALGTTRLSAHGRATPPFKLQGQLDSPDLGVFDQQFAGRLALAFNLTGSLQQPHLQTHGQARNLKYGVNRIGRLDWRADVDPQQPSSVRLDASDAELGATAVSQLTLRADGDEADHRITVAAKTARGDVDAALAGGFNRQRLEWGGRVTQLTLTPARLSPLRLQQPAGLLLGLKRLSLERACLDGTPGRLCLRLIKNVHRPGLRANWQLDSLRLASLQPLLPKTLQLQGRLDGDGTLRWVAGNVSDAAARMTLSDAQIKAGDAPPLKLDRSTLKLSQPAQALHVVIDLQSAQARLHADTSAGAADTLLARPLSGRVSLKLPDLSAIQPFVSELQAAGGRLDGDVALGGTLGRPRLNGSVQLADGSATLRGAGIKVTDINASIAGSGDGPLQVHGRMASGGGTVTLDGDIDPSQTPLRAQLSVKGENFQVADTPDVRAWVSPDLTLRRDTDGLYLSGQLTVPKADITPRGGLSSDSGVSVSSDQQIVGQKAPPPAGVLNVYAQLDVMLGDAVRFQGYGLTTRIAGKVAIKEQPQRPALGQGELNLLDGKYKAYGQDLDIKTGRLIFSGGPVTRPAIDILAVRKPREDIQVGVRVRGTLDKPQLSLTSSPAMPQEQQLSWLLFGQPLEQNSSANQSAVASAALSLGLAGGGYVAGKIGKTLGIDTVSVGSANSNGSSVAADPYSINGSQAAQAGVGSAASAGAQAAQLTLGKYLTPRLYVSYGVSLFQPGQTFRLLYTLGHGFKLQTESGVANGGDLIYSFERGK